MKLATTECERADDPRTSSVGFPFENEQARSGVYDGISLTQIDAFFAAVATGKQTAQVPAVGPVIDLSLDQST
jgi:hypothetical protein